MKITRITQKSGNKYELIIDNKKHIIYDDVLLKYSILKPCEIPKDVYYKLINDNGESELYNKILKFITFKMRSRKEIEEKLALLGADEVSVNHIIYKLNNQGYINDSKFIDCFIKDQIKLSLYGPDRIITNLCKKGISINNSRLYLENIPFEIWKERCNKIVDKKLKTLKNGSKTVILGKLRNELIQMGYNDTYFGEILSNLVINDTESLKRDYEKIKKSLEKKYDGEKLNYMIKQKLYAKGYNVSKLNM